MQREEQVGNYLHLHGEKRHYSLHKVSKKANIPISVISYIEHGLVEPGDRVKLMLAKALRVRAEQLFPED